MVSLGVTKFAEHGADVLGWTYEVLHKTRTRLTSTDCGMSGLEGIATAKRVPPLGRSQFHALHCSKFSPLTLASLPRQPAPTVRFTRVSWRKAASLLIMRRNH
jgi:hypothetical protein